MPRIPSLYIKFDLPITAQQIRTFRGAVAQKVGWQHDRFHNHQANGEVLYRYPLVQYKRIGGHAALLALGPAVEDIHHLFQQKHWELDLAGKPVKFSIDTLMMQPYQVEVWDHLFKYRLRNWLGLNEKNYQKYQALDKEGQKQMLQKILTGNLLSMAKGLDWYVEKPIVCYLDEIEGPFRLNAKGLPMMAHHLEIRTNVSLPFPIGLGKMASLGHGTVSKINQPQAEENT